MAKVLILDDNQHIRTFINRLLVGINGVTQAFEASTGQEAVALFKSHDPQIVLLDLVANVNDAKKCWLETCLETGRPIPEPQEEAYSGQLRVRLPKSLHKTLTEKAREENTSLNQYIVYQLARSTGQPAK